jgi:hypothetical protein
MLLTPSSHYLFFGSGDYYPPKQINKFSLNKKEITEEFQDPVFKTGISSMTLSPDSKSLYVATRNKLNQFSLKDGKVIQSRDIYWLREMSCADIFAMRVTRNNQYLITATWYSDNQMSDPQRKGSKELFLEEGLGAFVDPLCLWSTKDLTLVKT